MTHAELHPEHLIEKERRGGLLGRERVALEEHCRRCEACALERDLERDFRAALPASPADEARGARLVAALVAAGRLPELDGSAPRPGARSASQVVARDGVTAAAPPPRATLAMGALALSLAFHAVVVALGFLIPGAEWSAREEGAVLDVTLFVEPTFVESVFVEAERPFGSARDLAAADLAERGLGPRGAREARRVRAGRVARVTMGVVNPDEPGTASRDPDPGEPGEPSTDGPGPLDADALRALLAPDRVARAGLPIEGAPSRVGPPAGWMPARPPGRSAAEIEIMHNRYLRETASERPWLAQRELDLRRTPDGGYRYEGHRFAAIIQPDGSVRFDDRPAVQTNGFSASGTFDLSDLVMGAAGRDPYAAEREWFMRRTEQVRDELETRHRRETLARGLHGLRGRLVRVWRTTARSPEARRRRIFEIWDDIAEDDDGRRAREIVIAFVRDALPAGSADAYPGRELRALNASRESEEAFAPY